MELYNAIANNDDYSEIQGIAYLKEGQLITTPPRTQMKSLKDLPLPNRAAIPVEKYLETWKTHHGKSSMTISTQRGCPYTCKWCSTAVYGQSYRRRPPELVAAELRMLKNTYNPR
ncbi:hypothetical protein N7U66_10330 [Lacinutrix neustonica]|uniref:Radical SAM protein n=1 Tax=Lacinutrix neustonica TaxID=2980107 RepID=A0A9E8MXZ7_9FLAO|nr:hypothetical protein [Lacinutrix neustonica]WAC03772.1 hypothetical protein N7U66_10330 [Lacinutrix neustonica]